MKEHLSTEEREILDAEMTNFVADIVIERIAAAEEDRKLRGVETEEVITLSGNIDGTPYKVMIKPNKKGE